MAIALFTFDGLFAPLQALLGAFAPRRAPQAREAAATCLPAYQQPRAAAATPAAARAAVRPSRVVRVVRVFEGPQPRAAAGRMVISGRLADVCAELDRLAAAEAAAG
ncbi:MAG: hypothetical protein V4864_03605 [Pseudomonadota bacterium]